MLFNKPDRKRRTISLFIPAPPKRSKPYRERVIDDAIKILSNNDIDDFEILPVGLQDSGCWTIIKYISNEIQFHNIEKEIEEKLDSPFASDETIIEGIYHDA